MRPDPNPDRDPPAPEPPGYRPWLEGDEPTDPDDERYVAPPPEAPVALPPWDADIRIHDARIPAVPLDPAQAHAARVEAALADDDPPPIEVVPDGDAPDPFNPDLVLPACPEPAAIAALTLRELAHDAWRSLIAHHGWHRNGWVKQPAEMAAAAWQFAEAFAAECERRRT